MAMKRVSNAVSGHPSTVIVAVLILTTFLFSAYYFQGAEMEAEEETYLPDNELVNAQMEISEKYGTTSSVQVLVRSRDSDILTKDALLEMLEVEKAFLENEDIQSTLVPETNPQRLISIADAIVIGNMLLSLIDDMNSTFQDMRYLSSGLENLVNASYDNINQSIGTPWMNGTIVAVNASLTENTTLILEKLSQFQDVATGDIFSGIQDLSIDIKIGIMNATNDSDVKILVSELAYYDGETTQRVNKAIEDMGLILNSVIAEIMQLNLTVQALKMDPNATSNTTVLMALESLEFMLSELSSSVYGLAYMTESLDVTNTTATLDGAILAINYMASFLLTKDFSPEEGSLSAKGGMIIVMFNASALPNETSGETSDRFLNLEKSMVTIVESQNLEATEMDVMGEALISEEIVNAAMDSVNILLPIAFILVIVILAIAYRSALDVLFSFLALGFAITWVWGFGVILGFTFNPMTIAVPILIVGLGIDYGIHITLRYKEEIRKGKKPEKASQATIQSVGAALSLTTVTTVIAFLSNITSEMRVIGEFGVLCALGIIGSFVNMTTFVPACKQLIDKRKIKKGKPLVKGAEANDKDQSDNFDEEMRKQRWQSVKGSGIQALNKGLSAGAIAAEHHPIPVIIIVLLLTGGSAFLALGLSTEFDLEDFLPEDLEVSKDLKFMLNEFNFSAESAEILVKGDLTQHKVLKAMDDTIANMSNDKWVVQKYGVGGSEPDVTSILSVMRDVADDQTINNPLDLYSQKFKAMFEGNDTDGDDVPDTNIKSLYDWLCSNETVKDTVISVLHRVEDENGECNYDSTIIRINVDTEDNTKTQELYDELKEDYLPLKELVNDGTLDQSTITGMPILLHVILGSLNESMIRSMIVTVIASFIILTIIFWVMKKSLVLGMITTIPVILVMAWILGTMYLLGIPYNVLTISVTALTIGLGVDYAIHITHRFIEESENFEDVDEASRYTLAHTGTAVFGAAITTIAGFGILIFSILPPMRQFGAVISLTILYAFLSAVLVLPTMLVIWAKRRKKVGDIEDSGEKVVEKENEKELEEENKEEEEARELPA